MVEARVKLANTYVPGFSAPKSERKKRLGSPSSTFFVDFVALYFRLFLGHFCTTQIFSFWTCYVPLWEQPSEFRYVKRKRNVALRTHWKTHLCSFTDEFLLFICKKKTSSLSLRWKLFKIFSWNLLLWHHSLGEPSVHISIQQARQSTSWSGKRIGRLPSDGMFTHDSNSVSDCVTSTVLRQLKHPTHRRRQRDRSRSQIVACETSCTSGWGECLGRKLFFLKLSRRWS